MTSITLKAPAKVNLYLEVLKKRRDGFHELRTVFERINLFDTISIRKAECGISVTANTSIVDEPSDNLAYKAAYLILDYCKITTGLAIHIKKDIPMGAGLGGGSSDAASVLKGVNKLLGLGLTRLALMRLGAQLGSDVCFFIKDARFALGRGRGERLSIIKGRGILWHLLIYPNFKCSTKEIYKAYDLAHDLTLTKGTSGVTIKTLKHFGNRTGGLSTMLRNDLQQLVIQKKKAVGRILERLAASSGRKAIISGSGPSVFCLLPNRKEAISAKRAFSRSLPARERKGWRLFVVRTW